MNIQTAKQIINLTKESYNNIATSFSDSRNDNWPEVESLVKKYIKNPDVKSGSRPRVGIKIKILDLGCGNGRLIQLLKDYKNIFYTGLDNSEKLINKAEKYKSNQIKFILSDILNLNQFTSESFDKIFMIASFNHIPSQELQQKVMANLYRILKNNGILIMTNWNLWQIHAKKNIWQYKFKHNYQIPNSKHKLKFKEVLTLWQNKYPLYYNAFTLRELKKLFTDAGFKILKNNYINKNNSAHWWNGRNIVTVGKRY
ncbi:class I SAM-dependent methyltransferase [Candidatus Parcubacteria bacterium]|nr:class I SAM-dependent methyltransferase [Patescibacteria group bacterium]MBU4481897.1 class I SAM-dependent methyltransferase [Patescibacteria group bacterium]MCG2686622.1 class I SAM-dependent methyltransferase [Candidatus Parcubacteria bacterium]